MDEIMTVFSEFCARLAGATWYQMVKWPFLVLMFTIAAGGIYCARFGKKTLLCRAVSGTLNLCGIYQAAFILYACFPTLRALPFTLPFLSVSSESVVMLNALTMELSVLAPMLLRLMLLQLLVDFVEHLNPGGKTLITWFFSQCVTAVISLTAYLVGTAGFSLLLPCIGGEYAIIPVVLAAAVFLLMICGKLIFTVVMESGNPQYKKFYDFFTTKNPGTLLTVSALSFLLTCIVFAVLHATGSSVMSFGGFNMSGMVIILILLLTAEHFYTMYYCGKKK